MFEILFDYFKLIVEDVKKKYGYFWNKEWREKFIDKIFEEFLEFLYFYSFVKINDDGYFVIFFIFLRVVGEYQDFVVNGEFFL